MVALTKVTSFWTMGLFPIWDIPLQCEPGGSGTSKWLERIARTIFPTAKIG